MHFTPLEYIVILSTLLEFNPLFQAVKAVKNKSVKDVSFWTFFIIMTIGGLWLYYGIVIGNIPIIIGNSIKLFTAALVVVIFIKYRK
jgi:MtN3 and saliva related transmembrane protein